MKRTLILISMSVATICWSQIDSGRVLKVQNLHFNELTNVNQKAYTLELVPMEAKSWNYKRTFAGLSVAFASGMMHGVHETTMHHYNKFKSRHPDANDQFWDPKISWVNKYKNGDPSQGPAFFGSTTFAAPLTDAKHLLSVGSNMTLIGATCIMTIGEKRKWWKYAIDIAGMSLARSVGFHLVYSVYYR